LESTRASGFYPDIVMAGPAPLQTLRKLGAVEPQAKFFSRNRGRALVVRKGNPLGIRGLADVARPGARLVVLYNVARLYANSRRPDGARARNDAGAVDHPGLACWDVSRTCRPQAAAMLCQTGFELIDAATTRRTNRDGRAACRRLRAPPSPTVLARTMPAQTMPIQILRNRWLREREQQVIRDRINAP
jgi:hypothetical protein